MAQPSLRRLIALSILAAVLTIVLKTWAYLWTGSVGLLSDAMESGINFLAALTAYVSLWYSARPIDASHTYGHEKIEFFSSGLEGILIIIAGGGIIWIAIGRLLHPAPLEDLGIGSVIAFSASVINFVVGLILYRTGKKYHSIVLEADGQHLLADVWTSVAVLVGLGLVYVTHIQELDPILAILVGLNIMWTGLGLIRRSFDGLMDHAIPVEDQNQLRTIIREQIPEGTTFHALRTRRAGSRNFADFHLLVPGLMSVKDAHHIAEVIEAAVEKRFPLFEITIHIEPIELNAAWQDNQLAAFEPR